MTWDPAERIANAVLYEGFLLYPYRPSAIKNRQRWTFGVLCPPAFCRRAAAGDRSESRTECLVRGDTATTVAAKVRFLQSAEPSVQEREIAVDEQPLERLAERPEQRAVHFPPLDIAVSLAAAPLGDGHFKLRLRIENRTSFTGTDREEAMAFSVLSCHAVLGARGGTFVSLTDPPAASARHAESCENLGTWPVLVGDPGRPLVLASPIILPDFPQVAPESPGDLFDGTEIDELLSLRILTLAESEKEAMRRADERTRRLLERTEALSREELLALHGTWRREAAAAGGLGPGRRVRLRPAGRADIFDLELRGREATIVSVEVDLEGQTYFAVTVDDDPGQDLGRLGKPGHRFFFRPDEVEPL